MNVDICNWFLHAELFQQNALPVYDSRRIWTFASNLHGVISDRYTPWVSRKDQSRKADVNDETLDRVQRVKDKTTTPEI